MVPSPACGDEIGLGEEAARKVEGGMGSDFPGEQPAAGENSGFEHEVEAFHAASLAG